MREVQSWGRLGSWKHEVRPLHHRKVSDPLVVGSQKGLAFGMGRSYGDVCLNPDGILWATSGLDRFIEFDPVGGVLRCQAGVLLQDIQRLVIPRGWMLAVSPGTQMVTLGGAIANDVHGKNHHVHGSFGDHVVSLKLKRTDGQIIECGPNLQRPWFEATIGGLGLTGVIIEACIHLKAVPGPWLQTETIPYQSLDEFFELADASEAQWEYTVSWIDCVFKGQSRGLFMRANSTDSGLRQKPLAKALTMPFVPPLSLVNSLSLKPFNWAYFHSKKREEGYAIRHYESFFYPLDSIKEWNRMYGPKGFYQYQCVVPNNGRRQSIQALLNEISRSGRGSFLSVLKTFGQRVGCGMLSFPQPGVTLALDFPNHGEKTLSLFANLDSIVSEFGGRLYAAKDARMSRSMFESGYPRLPEFLAFRDPGISSAMSRRLMGS
jgi:FAD/FMN-containing dehydrogenase